MDLERMMRSIFCEGFRNFDLLHNKLSCNDDACTCDKERTFDTILDWYAAHYRALNNVNYIQYHSIVWNEWPHVEAIAQEISEQWNAHVTEYKFPYKRKLNWGMQSSTIELLKRILAKSVDAKDLLIRHMRVLLELDKYLRDLKEDMSVSYRTLFPIQTRYGKLIYRAESVIMKKLQTLEAFTAPVDPNYLLLNKRISSFQLVDLEYDYYTVAYKSLSFSQIHIEDVNDFKLAFIPGKFNLSSDYTVISEPQTDDNLIPFFIQKYADIDKYEAKVESLFSAALEASPDLIMMPELFTSPDLRSKLIAQIAERSLEDLRNPNNYKLSLFLTGSFHEEVSGVLHNRAWISDGEGKVKSEVYKMNRFILPKLEDYQGQLEAFRQHPGVEKISYNNREIGLFNTSLGRMAFFICVDFLNSQIEHILIEHCVDIIFVMAMTPNPSGGKFQRVMHQLGERNNAIVIICNNLGVAAVTADRAGKESRIVVYLPGFKSLYVSSAEMEVLTLGQIIAHISESDREKAKPKHL